MKVLVNVDVESLPENPLTQLYGQIITELEAAEEYKNLLIPALITEQSQLKKYTSDPISEYVLQDVITKINNDIISIKDAINDADEEISNLLGRLNEVENQFRILIEMHLDDPRFIDLMETQVKYGRVLTPKED